MQAAGDAAIVAVAEADNPLGRYRQRFQHHGVDQSKIAVFAPIARSHRQHSGHSESLALCQLAERESQVLQVVSSMLNDILAMPEKVT